MGISINQYCTYYVTSSGQARTSCRCPSQWLVSDRRQRCRLCQVTASVTKQSTRMQDIGTVVRRQMHSMARFKSVCILHGPLALVQRLQCTHADQHTWHISHSSDAVSMHLSCMRWTFSCSPHTHSPCCCPCCRLLCALGDVEAERSNWVGAGCCIAFTDQGCGC